MTGRKSWHQFYVDLARYWANERSRDPSTKVGAVIVRPNKTQASVGYNDFPRGVAHLPERYEDRHWKLAATVHAEENAILNAAEPVVGYTMYTTFHPCSRCARMIVQKGIREVIHCHDAPIPERWMADMDIAATILKEGGVDMMPW